jgi:hypothetical protein
MIKGWLGRIFALGEVPGEGVPESGTHVPMPSLDERANIYLRALHGDRNFTSQERLDARHHLLDAMASDVVARSQIPVHERERPSGFPGAVGSHPGTPPTSRLQAMLPKMSMPASIAAAQLQPRSSAFTGMIGLALVITMGIFGYQFWTSPVSDVVTADPSTANDFKSEVVTAEPSTTNDKTSESAPGAAPR